MEIYQIIFQTVGVALILFLPGLIFWWIFMKNEGLSWAEIFLLCFVISLILVVSLSFLLLF